MKKNCFKCGKEKDLSEFYRHKMMADGHLGKCKCCTKRDVKRRYYSEEGYERVKAYEESRRHLPHRVALRARVFADLCKNNPEKTKAHMMVGNAIRDKRLTKQPCQICGSTKVEAHHEDYSKPLEVIWFCKKHHEQHHHKNAQFFGHPELIK